MQKMINGGTLTPPFINFCWMLFSNLLIKSTKLFHTRASWRFSCYRGLLHHVFQSSLIISRFDCDISIIQLAAPLNIACHFYRLGSSFSMLSISCWAMYRVNISKQLSTTQLASASTQVKLLSGPTVRSAILNCNGYHFLSIWKFTSKFSDWHQNHYINGSETEMNTGELGIHQHGI